MFVQNQYPRVKSCLKLVSSQAQKMVLYDKKISGFFNHFVHLVSDLRIQVLDAIFFNMQVLLFPLLPLDYSIGASKSQDPLVMPLIRLMNYPLQWL